MPRMLSLDPEWGHDFTVGVGVSAVLAFNKLQSDFNRYGNRLDGFADEFSAILSRQLDERAK